MEFYDIRNKIHLFFYNLRVDLRYTYFKFKSIGKAKERLNGDGHRKIIVSLTSYGERLKTVNICIKSLLDQTLRPDEIRLYLGTDVTDEMIPDQLEKLQLYGVKIIRNCEDIKPHKKYFFAMQDSPDDIIITVDDDMMYDDILVEYLYKAHEEFPECIICTKARKILRKPDGTLEEYLKWPELDLCKEPTYQGLPTGVGGVLYPPGSLSRRGFDLNLIKKLCLEADDIWLRMMGVLAHTPVVLIHSRELNPYPIKEAQKITLNASNRYGGKNDIYLKNVEKFFDQRIDQEPAE